MVRQVQLKAEFAERYPSLTPGVWYTAAAVAGLVKGTVIVREGPRITIRQRVLDPQHFAFRGGLDRRDSWGGRHTRRVDRQYPADPDRHRRALRAV